MPYFFGDNENDCIRTYSYTTLCSVIPEDVNKHRITMTHAL